MARARSSNQLSRRTLLTGAGGFAFALPLLDAMLPRRARAADLVPPKRFLVWMSVNGTVVERWICPPAATPAELTLSEILQPLERHKADMVGVQNLRSFSGYGHAFASNLTGRHQVDIGYPLIYGTGPSLDQHIAKQWEGQTPIPSLQLGVQISSKDRDISSCVSWSNDPHPDQTVAQRAALKGQAAPKQGLPAESNPFAVFTRLFGGTTSTTTTAKRGFALRRSMLDGVLGQRTALARQLGQSDRAIVDNYLDAVRAIETQLAALDAKGRVCAPPALGADPTPVGAMTPWWMQQENVAAVLKLHGDLIAAAFACDLTRVIVLTVAGSGGSSRMPPAGLLPKNDMGDWHGVSHTIGAGNKDPLGRESLAAIDRWYYDKLGILLDGLKAVPQPTGGTLLSSSLVLSTNEYGPNGDVPVLGLQGSSNSHMCKLMPLLLFGQAGGALKTGRWMVTPMVNATQAEGRHMNKLYVSILNALGIPDQSFGDPSADQGPIDGLL